MISLLVPVLVGALITPGAAPIPKVWAPPAKLPGAPPIPLGRVSPVAASLVTGCDLQASCLILESDFASEDSVLLTARVACTGSESVGPAEVAFYEGHPDSGGHLLGCVSAGPWQPGELIDVSVRWGGRAGRTSLWCVVDPNNTVPETNETDNIASTEATLVTGVPFMSQEVDGFCHYAGQGMLFNHMGYTHTIHEMVETGLVPYSPIYFGGQFTGFPGIFSCQTESDMAWNGAIRNTTCSLELLSGWTGYAARFEDLVDGATPAETSVDPYYLPQPDYDALREHGIHSGHAVVIVGYSDSSVVINDPGVGLALLGEEPLPDPQLRGKNVVVPLDIFRLAVENSLGTSYLLLSYLPAGSQVTSEALLLASLEKALLRLSGDVSSYDQELVEYLQPASPAFGRDGLTVLAQDMNPATFAIWYQYVLAYYGGNLGVTLEYLEDSYWYLVGLSSVGLQAPAQYYHDAPYPHGASLGALAESAMARCDTSCALFERMMDVIQTSGGSTGGIAGHLDSLRTVSLEWLALEDSVAAHASDLREWLSETGALPLPLTHGLAARIWPSPCTGVARLQWDQPAHGQARAAIYDVRGGVVAILFEGLLPGGTQTLEWDTRETAPPGIYVVRLACPGGAETATRIAVAR
jgi:hypothetical protein